MCENCEHELATVYCHADAALLCTRCDGEVHRSKLASRHHRISLENVKKSLISCIYPVLLGSSMRRCL